MLTDDYNTLAQDRLDRLRAEAEVARLVHPPRPWRRFLALALLRLASRVEPDWREDLERPAPWTTSQPVIGR